jgi:hypothetical protein
VPTITGLNPLSTGTCGCVTAEVDYKSPRRWGSRAGADGRRARTAAGLSRDAPFHRWVYLDVDIYRRHWPDHNMLPRCGSTG